MARHLYKKGRKCILPGLMVFLVAVVLSLYPGGRASGVPLPGGTLDPLTIPKYVTPLVIPPVMPNRVDPATGQPVPNEYDIAVRQFKQQILPAGFPATTVWSYGPASDPIPLVNAPDPNSGFNYPAFTIETVANVPVKVRWRNELVAIDPTTGYPYPPGSGMRTFLPHLFFVDQTLHWANPPAVGCADGTNRTDCATLNPMPYTGPVPIVTHVHGAHVESHSDGYPEAWWLPVADNIPPGYAMKGSLFDDSTGTNPGNLGYVDYVYRNDQAAATIWYHDHSLGMTRLNVYAGPAGFWLIRGGPYDGGIDGRTGQPAVLPGPAPRPGDTLAALNTPGDPVRNSIREIPIVIQDRSFNADGSLFYPQSRVFFDGYAGPYVPDPVDPANPNGPISDIAPIWNPEAFFNTMVVNGTTWPVLEVAPALYRFRFLNGCDSRFLNLVMKGKPPKGIPKSERKRLKRILKNFPFYKIGNDQGFIPQVVLIRRGFATPLPGDGTLPPEVRTPTGQEGLLMGPAERADVIVDFRGLPDGTVIRVLNTAPDAPFGGFPVVPADPATTGQVMQFVVRTALLGASPTDPVVNGAPNPNAATDPWALRLNAEPPLGPPDVVRQVSLNEEESATVCVDPVTNQQIVGVFPPLCGGIGVPAAPKAALLGTVDLTNPAAPVGVPLKWTDTSGVSQPVPVQLQNGATVYIKVTENPLLGTTETWEIYNFTVDAHPIHLHLVRFQVVNREIFDPLFGIPGTVTPPNPDEVGYKDTVIAYPGQITRVKALFDISGLYVWHCHILEHEDNEMMRPFVVSP